VGCWITTGQGGCVNADQQRGSFHPDFCICEADLLTHVLVFVLSFVTAV